MSTEPLVIPEPEVSWSLPARGYVGMFGLILAEAAIFTIFIIAYIYNIGKSVTGPQPRDVLRVPVFFTICLWLSSLTIHFAGKALRAGSIRAFMLRWFLTIALGAAFLAGTAREWYHLIYDEGLTIRTNLFGTTYYSLVGLHAFHVTVGLIALSVVFLFALFRHVRQEHAYPVDVLSLYWHFVDVVWVVVFIVVYVVGR